MIDRRKTKKVYFSTVGVGGDSPVSVQSMTNTKTGDIDATINQINELESAGCEIIRVAVPDFSAVDSLPEILKNINIPLVADIHFDYRLALGAIKAGVHGLRLNPGNIGNPLHISKIVKEAKKNGIPIRIGSNAGSLSKECFEGIDNDLKKEDRIAKAMVNGARSHIKILEEHEFNDIIISLKSSDVMTTVLAYRYMAKECDYPFHIGITEAGPIMQGTVKSSIGLGMLLAQGLGDTIRVSLTDNPIKEIKVGHLILNSIGVRNDRPEIISCPTCGRTRVDVIGIAKRVEEALSVLKSNVKVAVMGCEVNGPGEAREADIGIAGGDGFGVLFKKGKVIEKVPEKDLFDRLIQEAKQISAEKKGDIQS